MIKEIVNKLWTPSANQIENANLTKYTRWLRKEYGLQFNDYRELWKWSVDHIEEFWEGLFIYFNVQYNGELSSVKTDQPMPHTNWFGGIQLNYTEHIFRNKQIDQPAIISQNEQGEKSTLTWNALEEKAASLQSWLSKQGLTDKARIAAYLPNISEASIAFFAANASGYVWSSCSPDFGEQSAIDRFSQIEPEVLIAVDTYSYNGKVYDRSETVRNLKSKIPSIKKIVWVSDSLELKENEIHLSSILNTEQSTSLKFKRVEANHPMWILFSSGTTGAPKPITQGVGGVLMEHLKYVSFHNDVKNGERFFWYTTTGWMMWNYVHASMLQGACIVLYDGSPAYPNLNVLWDLVETYQINHFGISAGFIEANRKTGIHPDSNYDMSSLKSIGSTGSPLSPTCFHWIYQNVKPDVWIASISGGTDICSAFVGGNPWLPVYEGEIQCRALGCDLQSFSEKGNSVFDEVGELVIKQAMPSMPIYFWGDEGNKKYIASYFKEYPTVWRHGDWVQITSRDTVVIHGRSDSTLNRGGIRIGTAEIYNALSHLVEVKDSLIVCVDKSNEEQFMPLFVVLNEGIELNKELTIKIKHTLKIHCSPRHIPNEIIEISEIPYTISGKKMEIPVKKILSGINMDKAVNKGIMRNPESIDFFVNQYLEENIE